MTTICTYNELGHSDLVDKMLAHALVHLITH
jgi:hypothetical protein